MTTEDKPIIAILGGTGQEGGGLAARWTKAGYSVVIGSRDLLRAQASAAALNQESQTSLAVGSTLEDAAAKGSIVVLTVPYAAQLSTLELVKRHLTGKILIDVTVPLVPPKVSRVQLPEGGSAVVRAQALLGSEVRVVSAFQNISFEALRRFDRPIDCDVLVCGDDLQARESVIQLAKAAGMRAWHAGPLVNSTAVEALTSLLIFMNIKYKSHSAGLRISGLNQAPEPRQLIVTALPGIPEVVPGDDLVSLILAGVARTGGQLQENDVLVLAQKVVSKAEGRYVRLADVEPSLKAQELATHVNKDARLIELILQESNEVIRTREDVIIVEHKLGFILANAGIDASNIGIGEEDEFVLLLPKDPDANATAIRRGLERATGLRLAVVINDSLGRAWRQGTVGTAIGVSGLQALLDLRGRVDRRGRELKSSQLGLADEVAASASLMMGQASEGSPIVLMRGVPEMEGEGKSSDLIRTKNMDLFR